MISLIRTFEWQRRQRMLQCDGNDFRYIDDESSRWNKRCLQARQNSDSQVTNETEKECVRSVVKSYMYLESETNSPLYRCTLVITIFGLCGLSLGTDQDTCRVILTRRRALVRHSARKLACSLKCGHMSACGRSSDWFRTVSPQEVDAFME